MPPLVRSAVPFVSPLTIGRLPVALKMLAGAESVRGRGPRRVARKAAKIWFRLAHGLLGLPARGEILVATPQGAKSVSFDGRNTHFNCLYMPEFVAGYEASSLALLDILVGRDGCFFDVGSNFGCFSLSIAARPGFTGRVHAFEPYAPSFADLSNMIERSALTALISAHRLALSDYDGNG